VSEQNAEYVLPGFLPPKERCDHAVVGICGRCWAEKRQNRTESGTDLPHRVSNHWPFTAPEGFRWTTLHDATHRESANWFAPILLREADHEGAHIARSGADL
jgi:hypothetical protein